MSKKLDNKIDNTKTQNNEENTDTLIEDDLKNISDDINKLSKSTKLKDILKKHKTIKISIDKTTEKVNSLVKSFEEEFEEPKEIITDETYEKYSKDIADFVDLNIDDIKINQMVKKYRSITKKILCCETYLKSKKMQLIECDKIDQSKINKDNTENENEYD